MNTSRAVITVLAVGLLLDLYRLIFAIANRDSPEVLVAVPHATIHFFVRIASIVLFLIWLGGIRRTGTAPRFPRLVIAWWLAFLSPPLLLLTATGRERLSSLETWLRFVVAESMNIVAAVLAIAIVHRISQRQQELRRSRKATARTRSAPPPVTNPSDAVVAEPVPRDQPVVTIAPIQPMGGVIARRRPSLEMMIRAQAVRRRSLREAFSALRDVLTRAARR